MATIIKAPNPLPETTDFSVFLSGSIEMGAAAQWQTYMERELADLDILILNPRRDDWDSTWEQSLRDWRFVEQVEWELDAMERATMVVMYFDPATKSPITLLELGLQARMGHLVVCCPDGFWRKGNVDVVCRRYGIEQVFSLTTLANAVRHKYTQFAKHLHKKG
jgi:hypothetical protein